MSAPRVAVIPGAGAGAEVVAAAFPLLRTLLPGARWVTLATQPCLDPDAQAEESLRSLLARPEISARLPPGWPGDDGGWPLAAAVRRRLLMDPPEPGIEAAVWDALRVGFSESAAAELAGCRAAFHGASGPDGGSYLLWLRQSRRLYANVRPVSSLARGWPDLVIVRENTEGLYVRVEREAPDGSSAQALRLVTAPAVARAAAFAARLAKQRAARGLPGKVTVVHKANVLRATCGLFRRVALETLAREGVAADERHVDACALELAGDPRRFDVILTSNLFGDVLSDLAAVHMGGLGAAPSGSYGEGFALFEPVHGSAPDIAGRGTANPLAAFLSAAMLLDHLGESRGAAALRAAAAACVAEGFTTPDMGGRRSTADVARRIEDLVASRGAS